MESTIQSKVQSWLTCLNKQQACCYGATTRPDQTAVDFGFLIHTFTYQRTK